MLADYPLVILAIGIVTVIGMIIALRINAFIALITAAILVSLLGPEAAEGTDRIKRVASAFGGSVGGIGIVIALAAVIGKCLMDSGAADRVVRTFLKLLGEKRASFALMGSGFVLAVPVFFDTVFYLLVPLARSLHRKTKKNYLMYLLAIAAGGAITHTLVPPTPGPLLMAEQLRIDIGLMIMIGALVAFPAALAGLVYGKIADGMMDVPMRQIGSAPEPEPIPDDQLPSLFWALIPVALPVLMIACSTVLSTVADAKRTAQLSVADITDWKAFPAALASAQDATSPAGYMMAQLETHDRDVAATLRSGNSLADEQKQAVVDSINLQLARKDFYNGAAFAQTLYPSWKINDLLSAKGDTPLSDAERGHLGRMQGAHSLLGQGKERMKVGTVERINRLLLEISFPESIAFHEWNTPSRKAASFAGALGNANLALLLSTALALYVLWKQRHPTLSEMAESVETALMSGGVIILITAGGGAFGAMLKTAQIGDAIKNMFTDASGAGLTFLFLGFGIAALLKVAQGSSTVAMITGSAMLAAMGPTEEVLGFNTVYLATAIGAGSLVGSWMNDSGFWIFTKMGGLTEVESLKSWTPMLCVLGVVSMAMTVLLAIVMPLV